MTLADVPVFRKDLRTLLEPMIWCVVLHWLYIAGVAAIFWVNGWPNLMVAVSEAAVATQWMFGGAFGLVTAAYFLAEERAAGTLVFLRRLPVSRVRIYAEKIGAALAALALLWICFAASHVLGAVGGLWPKEISEESITLPLVGPLLVGGVLVLVSLSLYLAALPVALVARQPAVVFLAGFAIWWAGFATLTLAVDAELSVSWELVGWLNVGLFTPLVAVALVLALAGRRLRFNRAAAWRFSRRARMAGLLWKSVTENTLLQAMCITFLVVALIVPQADSLAVTGVGLILIAALGTAAYDPVEKHGLHCVLYQHPVPRSQLFWAKTIAAIAPVLAVSAGAYVLWGRQGPMPFLTALALGSFAYACAVLLTLAFHRQLTAALATVVVVFLTLICPVLILELLMPHATSLLSIVSSDEIFGPGFIALQATAFPTALLAVGCLWAARRMATDRTVLTGSAGYRLSYFAGIYSVIVSVSALLTMAAWGGLISFLSRG